MHGLALDVGPKFGAKRLVGHEVHPPPQQVLKEELHNPAKAGTFTVEERIAFIERAVASRGAVGAVRVEPTGELGLAR